MVKTEHSGCVNKWVKVPVYPDGIDKNKKITEKNLDGMSIS